MERMSPAEWVLIGGVAGFILAVAIAFAVDALIGAGSSDAPDLPPRLVVGARRLTEDERRALMDQHAAVIRRHAREAVDRHRTAQATLRGLEFCPRCSSGPRQKADVVECPDCGYRWSGPRLLDIDASDDGRRAC